MINTYLTIDNSVNNAPRSEANRPHRSNPLVRVVLSAYFMVVPVINTGCNIIHRPDISTKVNRTELKPYQIDFLNKWKAKGRPNPLKNYPKATKYLRDKGYDPDKLTDSQALDALEHARNLARIAGIKHPEDY